MSMPDERAKRLSQLSPAKKALLEKWAKKDAQEVAFHTIPLRVEGESIHPSFVQEWNVRYPGNETSAILLEGPLVKEILERSFNELIRRHETLHTAYPFVDGKLTPAVVPRTQFYLSVKDLQAVPESERMDKAMEMAREELHRKLDLASGQVFYFRLLRLSSEQHLLIGVLSKIVIDIWAQLLFYRELGEIYDAFATGQPSPLPEPSLQYADYTAWQRRTLQGNALDTFLDYWKEQLVGAPELILPTYAPRTPDTTFQEDQLRLAVPAPLAQQLRAFSSSENCTLFMTLFAVFQLVMYRFTGQRDLVIGIDLSSRTLPGTENLIGVFTHQLPVRMRVADHLSLHEFLRQLQGVILDVYAHQGIPLGLLAEILPGTGQILRANQFLGAAVTSVNENMLLTSLEDNKLFFSKKTPRLSMISQPLVDHEDQEDLSLQIRDTPQSLTLDLVYHIDLYQRSTIIWLMDSYHKLLNDIVVKSDQSIATSLQHL